MPEIENIENTVKEIFNRSETLTKEEKQEIVAYRSLLKYVESVINNEIANQIKQQNAQTITTYNDYLESEIQKYAAELKRLSETTTIRRSKRKHAERVEQVKEKLQTRREKKELFQRDLAAFTEKAFQTSNPSYYSEEAYKSIFEFDMIRRTSFQGDSGFIIQNDNETSLNMPNINLALEVLKDRNPKNIKKLIKIAELREQNNYLKVDSHTKLDTAIKKLKSVSKSLFEGKTTKEETESEFITSVYEVIRILTEYNKILGIPNSLELSSLQAYIGEIYKIDFQPESMSRVIFIDRIEKEVQHIAEKIEIYRTEKIKANEEQKREKEKEIPEHLKGADIHALDRINYYCGTYFIGSGQGGNRPGTFISSDKIDENKQFGFASPERVEPVISHLQAAVKIKNITSIPQEEILKMMEQEELMKLHIEGQEALTEMINIPHR